MCSGFPGLLVTQKSKANDSRYCWACNHMIQTDKIVGVLLRQCLYSHLGVIVGCFVMQWHWHVILWLYAVDAHRCGSVYTNCTLQNTWHFCVTDVVHVVNAVLDGGKELFVLKMLQFVTICKVCTVMMSVDLLQCCSFIPVDMYWLQIMFVFYLICFFTEFTDHILCRLLGETFVFCYSRVT